MTQPAPSGVSDEQTLEILPEGFARLQRDGGH